MKNTIKQLLRDNAGREKRQTNADIRNGDEASIYIYDVISADWGVSAMAVINAIEQAGDAKTLNVHISSPGGDVFESRAIMAALRRFQGKTIANIDSLCASAATSIALSCGEVRMSDGAFFMIHNAACVAWGDKEELREAADLLEKIECAIVNDYTTKTGKDETQIRAWMDEETWFSATEAKSAGFIDSITSADSKAKNTWNLAAFANVPKELAAQPDPPPKEKQEPQEQPAEPAGFFMSAANANRLRLSIV